MAPFNGKFIPLHKRKAHNAGVRKRNAARRARKPAMTFAKKVKSVIKKMAEHKTIQYSTQANIFGYNAAGQGLLQFQLTPVSGMLNITQGTGQADRIGNQVRVVKATLKYVLSAAPIDATYNVTAVPQDVRFMITSNRQSRVLSPAVSTFFQNGDSSAAPTSNMQDMIQFVNKDMTTVHKDWRHKVGANNYTATSSDNNDYRLNVMKTVDLTKYYPKVLTWNDTSTTISEQSKWLTILMAPANLSVIDTTGTATFKTAFINYIISLTFEDV